MDGGGKEHKDGLYQEVLEYPLDHHLSPSQPPPEDLSPAHLDRDAAQAEATGLKDGNTGNTRLPYAFA